MFKRKLNTDWEFCVRLFPVALIDGLRSSGRLMTRMVAGKREYRALTESEADEIWAELQW